MPRAGETIEEWSLENSNWEQYNEAIYTEEPRIGIVKEDIKREAISLNMNYDSSNIYPDSQLGDHEWKYYEDLDKQNKDYIRIGAHLHYRRKKTNPQYTFIGIVIEKIFGGSDDIPNNKGDMIKCKWYRLKIHPTKKSLGLELLPNTIVPNIGTDHMLFHHLKKDGTPRTLVTYARYQYDSCSNSGITRLHTAPLRGILY
jgi:hypothetical protein